MNLSQRQDNNRDKYLQRTYGITLATYNDLLAKQGGGCAICGKTPKQEGRNLAVDHNHKTLEVRGILCNFCNRRVVGRHHDPSLFEAAARYLRQRTGLFAPKKKRKRRRKRK